jgi:hypothetical protein
MHIRLNIPEPAGIKAVNDAWRDSTVKVSGTVRNVRRRWVGGGLVNPPLYPVLRLDRIYVREVISAVFKKIF